MARKEKRYHFIYKTTNILTGRYYYGMHSTDNLNDGYLGSGKRLRYSINKYGKRNHIKVIFEYCSDRKSLIEREKEIINLNEIAKEDCMNLMVGGKGGFISLEAAKGGREALKIKFGCEYDNKMKEWSSKGGISSYQKNGSNLMKNNNRFDWKGKKHKSETRMKMSETSKGTGIGKNNSQFGTCWITNGIKNKKMKGDGTLPNGWKLGRVL